MKKLIYLCLIILMAGACGQSYEETKRLSRLERQRQMREDNKAKIYQFLHVFSFLGANLRNNFFFTKIIGTFVP